VTPPATPIEALGEWCVRNGLATAEEIDSCLQIRSAAHVEGKSPQSLGDILVARGILTPHQVAQALAAQKNVSRPGNTCRTTLSGSTHAPPVELPPKVLEAGATAPPPIPPSPLPSPGRPGRSRPTRTTAALITFCAAVLAVGGALVHFFLPLPAEPGSFEIREAEVIRAITKFQPRVAHELAVRLRIESKGDVREARASHLEEEAAWIVRLQNRAADRLVLRPVERPRVGGRIVGADGAGLRVERNGREELHGWERLAAKDLLDVLQAVLDVPDDADLLALAILAHRNGLADEAAGYFSRLRMTPLAPIAERYLTSRN